MNNESNKKFIYVFSRKDADTLLTLGYSLMREDEKQDIYIFLAKDPSAQTFSLDTDMQYCMSDTLMF